METGADLRDRDATFHGVQNVAIWGGVFDVLVISKASRATLRGVTAQRVEFRDVDAVDWEDGVIGDPAGPRSRIILAGCPTGSIKSLYEHFGIYRENESGGLVLTAKQQDFQWGTQ